VGLGRLRNSLVLLLLEMRMLLLLSKLLSVLRMLGVLLDLPRMLLSLLGVLLSVLLLGMGSGRMRDLRTWCRTLSLPRSRRRSRGRGRLLLLRWRCRLRLLAMRHARLNGCRMVLLLTGLCGRRCAVRSEMPLLLLAPSHVGLRVVRCAVPVGMISELSLLLLLLLLLGRCRLLLQ